MRRVGRIGLLLIGGILPFVPVQATHAGDIDEAVRKYRAWLQRPSLCMRTRGRTRLAKTDHIQAVRILTKDYGKPEAPKERVRYLTVSAAVRGCNKAEHLPAYAEWRAAHKAPTDAWLWFKSLTLDARHGNGDAVAALARKAPNIWLRAAAIRALAAASWRGSLELITELSVKPASSKPDAGLIAESLAAALLARRDAKGSEAYQPAAKAVIGLLDSRRVPLRSKIVIALYLKTLFGTDDVLGVNAAPWLRELKAGGGSGGGHDDRYGVTFTGIKAAGSRICYAIDASDSMLTPLTGKEKEEMRGPITGGGESDRDDGLPWHSIDTRFDLARELLIQSLQQLKPDRSFCIVLFGSEAALLTSTPGMIPAKPKSVQKAIAELEAIEAGPAAERRPHGTLRGDTNLHGAFDRAFRVKKKGLQGKAAYVTSALRETGADTVFLFSDGEPSIDDYVTEDRRDPEDHAGDPETGRKLDNTPTLMYYGPYVEWNGYLVDDIERMNLFRCAEIHCIGIGEANMDLLRRIAATGRGTTKRLGKDKK